MQRRSLLPLPATTRVPAAPSAWMALCSSTLRASLPKEADTTCTPACGVSQLYSVGAVAEQVGPSAQGSVKPLISGGKGG